jgi:hypothetical protein
MTTRAVSTFEISSWEEEPYDESDDGPVLSRVTVGKAFHGEVQATSVGSLLTCQAEGGEGYVASERISGSVHGRSGTFVVQHGGARGAGVPAVTFGHVVPGSGTGELRGLRGTVEFREDERGAAFTLDYDID